MATGALDTNGIWQYGEDDSETTFSALLNRLGSSVSTQVGKRKVLQVVNFTTTSQTVVSTNGSWQNTALAASITPTSATSKILILTSFSLQGLASAEIRHTIFRGNNTGTNLGNGTAGLGRHDFPTTYSESQYAHILLDNPATTSAQLYTMALYKSAGGNATLSPNTSTSSIILIEVAA